MGGPFMEKQAQVVGLSDVKSTVRDSVNPSKPSVTRSRSHAHYHRSHNNQVSSLGPVSPGLSSGHNNSFLNELSKRYKQGHSKQISPSNNTTENDDVDDDNNDHHHHHHHHYHDNYSEHLSDNDPDLDMSQEESSNNIGNTHMTSTENRPRGSNGRVDGSTVKSGSILHRVTSTGSVHGELSDDDKGGGEKEKGGEKVTKEKATMNMAASRVGSVSNASFFSLSHVAALISQGPKRPFDDAEHLLALQMALKCSDLGHLAAPLALHQRWVTNLEEEYFIQGDAEKELGLPISPLFDRSKQGISKTQVGFFDFVVIPMFSSFVKVFPGAMTLQDNLLDNYRHWKDVSAKAAKE
eukprot:CAMPEP_0175059266 /NCGR_PEP_ID=MMETSP0052_2-20121109/12335_1 /TAXON_ID=51329 ORGANISM="Polytomella parva, Strain SAG 63-3" /NCGR_SAMPLE_ID=MMETSP0052_2 /ASSEMBLY_ACC=CAM_ASM_000194 /LENGTH=351 /DNA_ID=CAMNT_0016324793 /DNA_START=87 /DNA_END=1142 /DNA_ORIENTATION=-